MILLISITLIVLLSCYVVHYTFRNKNRISNMVGMMISMSNSMMVSISLGTILGTFIQNKDITMPTIVAVLIGMVVGYLNGRPVSLMASVDGVVAGIMGGMMGSMLGVMLQPKSAELMIYFIDVVFVLVTLLLLRLIDEETKKDKQKNFNKKPIVAKPIVLIALLVFIGALVFVKGPIFSNASEKPIEDINYASVSNEIYEVVVTPTGYTPNNLIIKAGTSAIINFKTKELSCTGIIISDELGFNVSLKENTNNYIKIKSLNPGVYHYTCGMNMYSGTITVVE
ncbi:cupredoxin domain-containing protein [Psychrobacillus sp. NPDC058041]|uniref:cupredoxin domain-containing protein n=1 Tax=Psychrobacillus sp. NPDC058041 TaxID=3346310 RepID=UPI0036DF0254